MIILINIFLILFLMAIIISGTLFVIYALDSIIKKHDLPTSSQAIKGIIKIIKEYSPQAQKFYDLGCGHGRVAIKVKKYLPNLKVYGVDKNKIRIFFCQLKNIFKKNKAHFKHQDIFKTNLKNADIIYTYLWYDLMPSLKDKLQNELKSGSLVITNTSNFSDWQPIDKIKTWPNYSGPTPNFETLFVYKKE